MPKLIEIDPGEIDVPETVMAARLGFKQTGRIPGEFQDLFRRSTGIVVEAAAPLGVVETYPCRFCRRDKSSTDSGPEGFIEVPEAENLMLKGRLVSRHLEDCRKLTLMLVTLGGEVDRAIETAHEEDDELLSFFLDGVASELVEFAARKVDMELRTEMKGHSAGARISPGYGDLPLSLNRQIVETLDGEEHGITCRSDSFVLLPRKTISGFMGWKRKEAGM